MLTAEIKINQEHIARIEITNLEQGPTRVADYAVKLIRPNVVPVTARVNDHVRKHGAEWLVLLAIQALGRVTDLDWRE